MVIMMYAKKISRTRWLFLVMIVTSIVLMAPAHAKLGSQSFGEIDFSDSVVTTAEVEAAEAEFSSPGLLPDHPFYFLKRGIERAQLMLTFDEEHKTRLHLKLAKVRLAEAKKLAEQNKAEHAREAANEFSRELNETKKSPRGIWKNTSLVRETEELTAKSAIVLSLILDKVPMHAKPAIEQALNNSLERKLAISEKSPEEISEQLQEEKRKIRNRGRDRICIQVITPARSPEGEIQEFPTPCDVPEGWEKLPPAELRTSTKAEIETIANVNTNANTEPILGPISSIPSVTEITAPVTASSGLISDIP